MRDEAAMLCVALWLVSRSLAYFVSTDFWFIFRDEGLRKSKQASKGRRLGKQKVPFFTLFQKSRINFFVHLSRCRYKNQFRSHRLFHRFVHKSAERKSRVDVWPESLFHALFAKSFNLGTPIPSSHVTRKSRYLAKKSLKRRCALAHRLPGDLPLSARSACSAAGIGHSIKVKLHACIRQ